MGRSHVLAGMTAAGLACASLARADTGAPPAEPRPHVLAEASAHDQVQVLVSVAVGEGCAAAATLAAVAPWSLRPVSACVVELTGPSHAARRLTVAGRALDLPAAGSRATPAPAPSRYATEASSPSGASAAIHLRAAAHIPVGMVTTGAHLDVQRAGIASSDVELTVQATGGRLRALRWIAPGQAEVDVLLESWSPVLTIEVAALGQPPLRVEAEIDPGPPTHASLDVPARVHTGVAVPLRLVVTTRHGQPVPADQIEVRADGCRLDGDQLRCDQAGRVTLTTWVRLAGSWAPIDQRHVEVEAPPRVPAPPPPERVRPVSWLAGGWSAAGATEDGWRVGVLAGAQLELGPGWSGQLGLGWSLGQAAFAPVMPVAVGLAVDEQELAVRAGARRSYRAPVPWSLAATAAPALVWQHGVLGGRDDASVGLRAVATATVGAGLVVATRRVWIDAGARASVELVAPRWGRAPLAWFVEVSVAGR